MKRPESGNISFSLILLVILLALVTVGGAYTLRKASTPAPQGLPKTLLGVTPAPSPITDDQAMDNTFYVGTFKGEQAVYIQGQIKTIGAAYQENYSQLKDPHRVTPSLPQTVQQINGLNIDETKKYLYVSINLEIAGQSYPDNLMNKVYQIDSKKAVLTELWSNKIGTDTYPGAKGAAFVQRISPDRNFLVLSLVNCYACEGTEYGLVVINTSTRQERYVEQAGNLQFDLPNKQFTYQKLNTVKEPCGEALINCNNGLHTMMKPIGPTLSAPLP